MSNTEIYAIKKNGEPTMAGTTENSFRGGLFIWTKLCEKYNIEGGMFGGGFEKLWKLTDTGTLEAFENLTMKTTFDRVIAKKEDIPAILEAFEQFDKAFPGSSLLEQAEIIRNEILNNDEMIAVCWNQTSNTCTQWEPDYDDNDEEIHYNINTNDNHWFLTV